MTTTDLPESAPPVLPDLSALRGTVLLPQDPAYADAATAWNLAVPQRPSAVVTPADAADLVALVRLAAQHGVPLAAQPGGHGATRALDDAVLVRTAAFDEIWVDADAAVARVGAGVRWGQLLAALDGTGLVALAGSNPDVSVVGYLLGGGMSWFGRRYGVAASAVRAVEIVDGSGSHRWVDDESDPDLMWALRGGGGSFGIVTRVELDLQREPSLVGGSLVFPATEAGQVLRAYAAVTATAPDGLTCWASLMHFPDLPFLPDAVRGRSCTIVQVTWLGEPDAAPALLAPIRGAGTLLQDTVGPLPVGRLGEVAAEPTDPTPGMEWSASLARLDPAAIDAIVGAAGDRDTTALLAVQVRHQGGAFASTRSDRPAATGSVAGAYLVHALGVPFDPALAGPIRHSLAAVADACGPAVGGRTTLTLLAEGAPLAQAFDEGTLERLRAVRRAADPYGIIRSNHPLD